MDAPVLHHPPEGTGDLRLVCVCEPEPEDRSLDEDKLSRACGGPVHVGIASPLPCTRWPTTAKDPVLAEAAAVPALLAPQCVDIRVDHAPPPQIPCPVFESYQALSSSDYGDNAVVERHPQKDGIYARLDGSGKLWLMDDADASPPASQLATPKPTILLCALTGGVTMDFDEEPVRPSLCWAPALGQYVVLASSDGCTIEYWHARRDLRRITRKAVFSPYQMHSSVAGSINSVSCDSGGEYCMASDELRIFIWNLDRLNGKQRPQVVLDLTPADDEELCEVIVRARFHPIECATVVIGFDTGRVAFFDISRTRVASQVVDAS